MTDSDNSQAYQLQLHYPHYLICMWCDGVMVWWCYGGAEVLVLVLMCSPLLGATLALADVNSAQLAWQPVVFQHCDTHSYIMIK